METHDSLKVDNRVMLFLYRIFVLLSLSTVASGCWLPLFYSEQGWVFYCDPGFSCLMEVAGFVVAVKQLCTCAWLWAPLYVDIIHARKTKIISGTIYTCEGLQKTLGVE